MSVSEVICQPAETEAPVVAAADTSRTRKRPKPGERREQILQALASMLEKPGSDRITTAALASSLSVSEAALYRHFASKAQMFEGLIEFIEQSVFTLVQQIVTREVEEGAVTAEDGARRAARVVAVVLQFAERNPGMVRVMVGDAILFEHERLQTRMNQFYERIESTLRQCLRPAADALGSSTPTVDANVGASVLSSFMLGRMQRFARTGFRRLPTEHLDASLGMLL